MHPAAERRSAAPCGAHADRHADPHPLTPSRRRPRPSVYVSVIDEGAVIGHGSRTLTLTRHQVGPSDYDASHESVWSLEAELVADGLLARTTFWLGPDGVEERLDEFFAGLERDWRGWNGTRTWQGMEGGLSLRCTHDGRGTIAVAVSLEHASGSDWQAKAVLSVDAGAELSGLVRDLARLLTPEH